MQSATGRRRAGCAYNDGLIYVVGGDRQSAIGPTTTEIYNLTSKTWAFGSSLLARSWYISAIQYQQEVYVFRVISSLKNTTITRLNSTNFEEIKTLDIPPKSLFRPAQIVPPNICLPGDTVPECSEYLGDVHLLRYNTLGLVLHSLKWLSMSKRVGVIFATLFRYCLALLLKMHPRAPVVFLKWESLFFI